MSASVANLEEAAGIAAEYISSLDNLPSEVQHLMQEMRHKEARSQELQQEIAKDGSRYVRHALRGEGGAARDLRGVHAELGTLSGEKRRIAERVVELVSRARGRLEHDLGRVLVLQGEGEVAVSAARPVAAPVEVVEAVTPVPKKRKMKGPSPTPVRSVRREVTEEEEEEGGESEDKQIYCFCQKLSYGEMIACDNKDCPYQWFHLPCVNLKAGVPLPEIFYCDECVRKGNAPRKGRKKNRTNSAE